ncbi:N-acetylglucosamine-6-phosphate deacetylase [Chitinophaga caseinilytica]|uniref:N-acetylglucosamine-6-phosphate deacetylase n=1 Tax=Chitinophaga caseinilytica TaxID=2267521 RepID=A0ABZ2Z6C6_9BACT
MLLALTQSRIFTGKETRTGEALLLENGRILGLVSENSIPSDYYIIHHPGMTIVPGLLDLQIYGGGGVLFSDAPSSAALYDMAAGLVKTGTSGFLITLATNRLEVFEAAMDVVRENPHPAVLGLHLEGPYINPVKRGAHIPDCIRKPERREVEALLKRAAGTVKMMTIAPELMDADIIRLLLDHGVVLSAGHSNATFEEGKAGFDAGIQTATHLFNAMSPFHHRDVGLPGAVYQSNAHASIIPDGIHVSYEALSISKKVMGERLFLITDAVEKSEGAYPHIRQKDRFTLPDGTLSGSAITLAEGIRNCVQHVGIPFEEAVRMATAYPAKLMGYTDIGAIRAGFRANLTLLDAAGNPGGVYLDGQFHQ